MTPSPEPRGSGIWATLRRRKLAEWILAYAATAWSLLQALEYAVDTFHWPESIREISTIAALCGLPIAVVIAWYHGERGEQRVSGVEMLLIALLLLAGGGIVWRYQPAVHDAGPAERLVQAMPGAVTAASVAVLPFRALSTGADDGYFADGLTEEIINALSALDDLLVTARTSAFFFKGKDLPVPEIAATLGVAHVVDGSVRRTGDRVRITAQLIRAADGFNLWSETYEHQAGDAFAIQTRIAASIANALGILLDERKHGQMDRVGVRDVETFVVFQRGVEYFNRAHNEGPLLPLLARANAEFEAALERTPELAQAYFYHADFYAHLLIDVQPGRDRPVALADGLSAEDAEHQLTVDFDAAFRHERDASQRRVIQVLRTTVSHDWRHLGEQIARAYAGWSNCRHGLWIDQTAVVLGYGEAALAHDTRRARCDPIGGDWTREAITAVWLGRAEQGLEAADRIEARRSGQDRDLMHARILAYLALGRHAEAEALYSAGNLDATGATPGIKLLALQIPAAAGRAQEWGRLRPSVENDPLSLLIGAAVFGDRATANRTAAEIDALRLGPAILLRIGDRCGCGAPFDLDATPRFAHQLREAGLAWLPPRPIQFPLKEW